MEHVESVREELHLPKHSGAAQVLIWDVDHQIKEVQLFLFLF